MPAPLLHVDPKLIDDRWCTAPQREYMEAVNEHQSMRAAARALGVNYRTVVDAVNSVKRKAAIFGYAPGHDLIHPVAPGQRLRGASHLYRRGEPQPVLSWVKSTADDAARQQIIEASLEAAARVLPRLAAVEGPGFTEAELCTVYTVTDFHVGMRAWGAECGVDWDLAIAERTLLGSFERLVAGSPRSRVGVVVELGDWMHFDSLTAETPASKHPLDADSRVGKIVDIATTLLLRMIDMALHRHDIVPVVIAEGNHDPFSAVWLRKIVKRLYANEPRVMVVDSELPYYAYQHGNVMLGWHHGHLAKKASLPGLFAARFSKLWGATEHRYIHCGHMHHTDEKEYPGVFVIQHPTLAAADAYSARSGYVSEQSATAITYHARYGKVYTNTVNPKMLV
jgi:hypothetical protein